MVVILIRAGLGLDPVALRKLSCAVFRLAFSPCLAEMTTAAIASHLLLGFPWLWGIMLGLVHFYMKVSVHTLLSWLMHTLSTANSLYPIFYF